MCEVPLYPMFLSLEVVLHYLCVCVCVLCVFFVCVVSAMTLSRGQVETMSRPPVIP